LSQIASENPSRQVMLKADAQLDSTRLIGILKIIKQAGVTNIYMVTTTK
jgi:biopolymer transport protein ExbD